MVNILQIRFNMPWFEHFLWLISYNNFNTLKCYISMLSYPCIKINLSTTPVINFPLKKHAAFRLVVVQFFCMESLFAKLLQSLDFSMKCTQIHMPEFSSYFLSCTPQAFPASHERIKHHDALGLIPC